MSITEYNIFTTYIGLHKLLRYKERIRCSCKIRKAGIGMNKGRIEMSLQKQNSNNKNQDKADEPKAETNWLNKLLLRIYGRRCSLSTCL